MLKVVGCLVENHDFRLVALAAAMGGTWTYAALRHRLPH